MVVMDGTNSWVGVVDEGRCKRRVLMLKHSNAHGVVTNCFGMEEFNGQQRVTQISFGHTA